MEKNKAAVELGRKGGKATLKSKGKKHFKELIKIRWDKHKAAKKKVVDSR